MTSHVYELWLIWQNPHSRQRYHAGTLAHKENAYSFTYVLDGPRTLTDALEDGYRLHLAFPERHKIYRSQALFNAFSRRLPDPNRPDFPRILNRVGLSPGHTPMDLLRATGGRLATDTYEFVPPTTLHNGKFDINFTVAEWRYYDGDTVSGKLRLNRHYRLNWNWSISLTTTLSWCCRSLPPNWAMYRLTTVGLVPSC